MEILAASLSPKEDRRIFRKISIDPQTKCWNWTGSKGPTGYGLLWFRGRTERIHRVMYAYMVAPIPRGRSEMKDAQIDHLCKNTSCCNPEHLELVDARTNTLRSDNVCGENARKTHCKKGHPLSDKLRKNSRSRIFCTTCDSIRHRNRLLGPDREYWLKKAREASLRYYKRHKKKE